MLTKLWTKKETQKAIREMREAGFTVDKIYSGYESFSGGKLVFKAMVGNLGYLIRHDKELFDYD